MNLIVNLSKRVKTSQCLRYLPVALSSNGRVKPDVVIVNGQEERPPEGGYYLDWPQGTSRVRVPILNEGMRPVAACLKTVIRETESRAAS